MFLVVFTILAEADDYILKAFLERFERFKIILAGLGFPGREVFLDVVFKGVHEGVELGLISLIRKILGKERDFGEGGLATVELFPKLACRKG